MNKEEMKEVPEEIPSVHSDYDFEEEVETRATSSIGRNRRKTGELQTSDDSGFRSGCYHDIFTFSLAQERTVEATMIGGYRTDGESGVGDPYLYLLRGNRIVDENDDDGISLNSRIQTRVPAGNYKLLATSFHPDHLFQYAVTLLVR